MTSAIQENDVRIAPYNPAYRRDFERLNRAWLEQLWVELVLTTNTVLAPAVRLYRRHGFTESPVRSYPERTRANLEMYLELREPRVKQERSARVVGRRSDEGDGIRPNE